jgi:hypothetical protein
MNEWLIVRRYPNDPSPSWRRGYMDGCHSSYEEACERAANSDGSINRNLTPSHPHWRVYDVVSVDQWESRGIPCEWSNR